MAVLVVVNGMLVQSKFIYYNLIINIISSKLFVKLFDINNTLTQWRMEGRMHWFTTGAWHFEFHFSVINFFLIKILVVIKIINRLFVKQINSKQASIDR